MTVVSWTKSVARQIVPDAIIYSRSMRLGALNEPLLSYVLPHVDGGIAIDVGANTGVYSRAFANRTPKVVA